MDTLNAIECVGKKYGYPRRVVTDTIINVKMKVGQGKNGIEKLYNDLTTYLKEYNSQKMNPEYLEKK